MSRFEEASQEVYEIVEECVKDGFRNIAGANIRIIFDTKKRKSGGKYVLGRMKKANELEKHLSEGNDYIMFLDFNVWNEIESEDKIRLVRHELQHCDVDIDSETNPYKVRGHEVTDFYEEINRNTDDPRWAERLGAVAASIYEED